MKKLSHLIKYFKLLFPHSENIFYVSYHVNIFSHVVFSVYMCTDIYNNDVFLRLYNTCILFNTFVVNMAEIVYDISDRMFKHEQLINMLNRICP